MRDSYLCAARLAGLAWCIVGALPAHANLVTNGSFELGTFSGGTNGNQSLGVGSTAMTGWTVTTDSLSWLNGSAFGLAPFAGAMYLDLTDTNDSGVSGGVTQTIGTVAGDTYLLTYRLGGSTLYNSELAILATAGAASATCTGPTPTTTADWTLCSLAFTATAASTTITLAGNGPQNSQYLGLDGVNVELTSAGAIPEPTSAALVLLALLGAGAGTVGARRGARSSAAV